jgi:hypothetical protein
MASDEAPQSSAALLPPIVHSFIRQEYSKIDPALPEMLGVLTAVGAAECWHKKSTFKARSSLAPSITLFLTSDPHYLFISNACQPMWSVAQSNSTTATLKLPQPLCLHTEPALARKHCHGASCHANEDCCCFPASRLT